VKRKKYQGRAFIATDADLFLLSANRGREVLERTIKIQTGGGRCNRCARNLRKKSVFQGGVWVVRRGGRVLVEHPHVDGLQILAENYWYFAENSPKIKIG